MNRFTTLLAAAVFAGAASSAGAAVITDIVGDKDGLGIGVADGGIAPAGPFDNRSAAEIAATDGSQFTDIAEAVGSFDGTFGSAYDFVDFLHTFASPVGTIVSVVVEFGFAGMQSNDDDVSTKDIGEDGLFVDGVLIDDAFEPVDQGGYDFDVFSVALPASAFALFADGSATIRIDSNSCGGTCPTGGESPIFYDYSEITITTRAAQAPEPGALALLGLGLAGLGFARRRR